MVRFYRNTSLPARILRLLLGLMITALGTQIMVTASIGLNPRGILVQGLMAKTGLRFGTVTQLLGLILILISTCFRLYPGIGTVLNVVLIGYIVDLYALLPFWATPNTLLFQILLFLPGLFLFSLGLAMYLSEELGSGPRDSIMLLCLRLPHSSVALSRTILDVFSAGTGYFLGGPVGIGSILAVMLSGCMLQACFRILHKDPRALCQKTIVDIIATLRRK